MYVKERLSEIWNVDLVAFSSGLESISVRDSLLFTGFGTLQDSAKDLDAPRQQTYTSEELKFFKNNELFKENTSFDVVITYVKDPDNIYLQKVCNVKEKLGCEQIMY